MKYLKNYKLFESNGSLEAINEYIDEIVSSLEYTNFVMVRNFTRYVNVDPSQPDVKVDVNHIKIEITNHLDEKPYDDFLLTDESLSDIKSLYNYMLSTYWVLKFFKIKYYEGIRCVSKDVSSMEEFENLYNDFVEDDKLISISLLFSEQEYLDDPL